MKNHWFRYLIMKWGVKVGSFFFLTFVLFFCFTSNVLAYSYSVLGNITNNVTMQVEPDYASSPISVPVNSSYNFYDVRAVDIFIGGYSISADTNYQLEFVLTNQTLESANIYTVNGYNGEECLTDMGASLLSGYWLYFAFECPHATNSITITVKNSANSYLWSQSQTNIFSWERATLRSAPERINTSPSDTDVIINNQNANTQSIINNNNQNTQQIIDSNKVCKLIDKTNIKTDNKYLSNNGSEGTSSNYGITDYISTNKTSFVPYIKDTNNVAYCFYDETKTLISCGNNNSMVVNKELTIPNGSYYARFTIRKDTNKPQLNVCTNGNQAVADSVNDLNDSITDDDVGDATDEASDFFSDFSTDTFGLTSIITAPLNLIQSLTSSTCSTLHLPLPYLNNKYLDLPCMSDIYSSTFGTFFTMYQTITFGIIAYWVCVRIFNMVKDFKNPEHDEIEVVDL